MSDRQINTVKWNISCVRCINCNIPLRKSVGWKKKINTVFEAEKWSRILENVVTVGDVLCGKCRIIIYQKESDVNLEEREVSIASSSHYQPSSELPQPH